VWTQQTRKEVENDIERILTLAAQRAWAIVVEKGHSGKEANGTFTTELYRIRCNPELVGIAWTTQNNAQFTKYLDVMLWQEIAKPFQAQMYKFSPQEIAMLKRVYDYVTPTNEEITIHLHLEEARKAVRKIITTTTEISKISDHKEKENVQG
jgi:hypothetical protein